MSTKYLWALMALPLVFSACSDDDDDDNPMTGAESTTFRVNIENVSGGTLFSAGGVFNTPAGDPSPGPLTPGKSYEVTFNAAPGSRLSFATMFVPSNDLFYAPSANGIALFDGDGNATMGDITSQISLWDAGTEEDQEPGLGGNQPQRGTGGPADDNTALRLAADDFGNLPAVADVIRVMLSYNGANNFTLSIENISDVTTLSTSDNNMQPVPLAPGVWVVHSADGPLFSAGQPDGGNGLEALAEDGDPSALGSYIASMTGLTSPLAPGVFAVFTGDNPMFTDGQADFGEGLEALAEDGDPAALASALSAKSGVTVSAAFNTPLGAESPGPLLPDGSYEFSFEAEPGQRLVFATMLVQTNDLFFAPAAAGLALFDGSGSAISGDVTEQIDLWDAGTEVNQYPGTGPDQAPRQAGPDTGPTESGLVQIVDDGFSYPAVNKLVRISITPQ